MVVEVSPCTVATTFGPKRSTAAAIEAGAGNVMSAYMDLNGVPAAANQWLLDDVLRDALGFAGFVVSDAQAVHDLVTHHFAADLSDAAARAQALPPGQPSLGEHAYRLART